MNNAAMEAGLDQFAAHCRDERRKLALLLRKRRLSGWWLEHHRLAVLVEWLVHESLDQDHAAMLVRCCLQEPWKYRAEYCIAECKRADPPPKVVVRIAGIPQDQ
jgi:hypothetical protein